MKGIIYIVGALIFGVALAFLKPIVDGPWLVAIAVVYFGLLRLGSHYIAKLTLRRAIADTSRKQR